MSEINYGYTTTSEALAIREVVGFTASCFDLGPHAGHIAMLAEAKSQCDYLVVALQVDPSRDRPTKNKPVQSVVERAMALRACKYVDEIIPYETEDDLIQLLHLLQPHKRFLGEDYINKEFTGKDIAGIDIVYCGRKHSVSSSGLRFKILNSKSNLPKPIGEPSQGTTISKI